MVEYGSAAPSAAIRGRRAGSGPLPSPPFTLGAKTPRSVSRMGSRARIYLDRRRRWYEAAPVGDAGPAASRTDMLACATASQRAPESVRHGDSDHEGLVCRATLCVLHFGVAQDDGTRRLGRRPRGSCAVPTSSDRWTLLVSG